jgi:hypothetical protein
MISYDILTLNIVKYAQTSSLFQPSLFWYFNIIILINPFGEHFESIDARNQTFSISTKKDFDPVAGLILIAVLSQPWSCFYPRSIPTPIMFLPWILPDPDTISIPDTSRFWFYFYPGFILVLVLLLSRFHPDPDPVSFMDSLDPDPISILDSTRFWPYFCPCFIRVWSRFFHGSLPILILFVSRILPDPDPISISVSSQLWFCFYPGSIPVLWVSSRPDLIVLQTSFLKNQRKMYMIFQKLEEPLLPLLRSRCARLDLPFDLGRCHGKFGDASYYSSQVHKEQIRKNRKFAVFFQKMRGHLPHPPLATPTPSRPSSGPRKVSWKVWWR